MIAGDFRHLQTHLDHQECIRKYFRAPLLGYTRTQERSTRIFDSGCPIGQFVVCCRRREALCQRHIHVECLREGHKSPKTLRTLQGTLGPLSRYKEPKNLSKLSFHKFLSPQSTRSTMCQQYTQSAMSGQQTDSSTTLAEHNRQYWESVITTQPSTLRSNVSECPY
jgi:hypothetical protein